MRAFTVALASVLAAVAVAADEQPSPVRLVRLDVIATDARGQSVDTLKPSDFDVREEGAVQPIEEARFVRAGQQDADRSLVPIQSAADERIEAKGPNTRLVAIFLDDYHVSAGNSARARGALLHFVDEYLEPGDLLAVMRPLDSLFSIRLTRDRERNRQAILDFNGRLGDYTPKNSYERNFVAGSPARIDQLRAQITTSALNALALHMGSLDSDARKTLIVVSEELPRADRRRGLEGLPTIDTVARSANRHNVSVYAVNPLEAVASGNTADAPGDSLQSLAASTNGQVIAGMPDLVEAMRPIAADSSAYYLLRYKTSRTDGRFHDVQISVKKPGVSVRTRKGYWAVPPDEELRAALLKPRAPVRVEPPRRISPLIRPWFGAARGENGQTRVTFVWEPAVHIPGTKQPLAAHVLLKVLASDDRVLFEGAVQPTGPLGGEADVSHARAEFDAAPGNLRVRMSIQDQTSQAIDSDSRDVNIRDLREPVAVGTPLVYRGRNARDFRALDTEEAAPVSSREFSRTERVVIRFPVYAPDSAQVTATLQNRKGQVMRDLAPQPVRAGSPYRGVDLSLAGFAAGDYRVAVVAKTPAATASEFVEFRITN